jgi:hypothetical protein
MAGNRLRPVHLDNVTPWALLIPLNRAPASLAGRERGPGAVEMIDSRASPEQFGQPTQLDAATRPRQTSSSITREPRRATANSTIYQALPPQHHQLHQRFVPNRSQPTATACDLTGDPPSRQNFNRLPHCPGLCRMPQGPQQVPHFCQRRNTPHSHYLRRQPAESLTAARLAQKRGEK